MNIICLSILASTIILSDEIINGKLKISKRLFNWIEKRGVRVSGTELYHSEKEGNTTAESK